jgi:hypothetical protein
MHMGLEQVAAPSSVAYKTDLELLSADDCSGLLSKLSRTPLYKYRYKKEASGSKPHLGVMAEEAPDEMLGEDRKSVRLLATIGFMLASIKALAAQQQVLLNRLEKLSAK